MFEQISDQLVLPRPRDRRVFLNREIDPESIGEIVKHIFEVRDHDEYLRKIYQVHGMGYTPDPIELVIDSPGGFVYQTLGLVSIMTDTKGTAVNTLVTGTAFSGAFILAISGRTRRAYRGATLMYHQMSTGFEGKVQDMEEEYAEVQRLEDRLNKIVLDNTGIKAEKLIKVRKTKLDWYIDVDEALKLDCLDEIV